MSAARRKKLEVVATETKAKAKGPKAAKSKEAKAKEPKSMLSTRASEVTARTAKAARPQATKLKEAKPKATRTKVTTSKAPKSTAPKIKERKVKPLKSTGANTKKSRSAEAIESIEWSPETIPSVPHMEDAGIALLAEHLKGVKIFLEYGSGGSSIMAAHAGIRHIYSVDSDLMFLQSVQKRLIADGIPRRRYVPVYVDIGKTGDWGRPINDNHARDWPNYCSAPWIRLAHAGEEPSLVLIDGRFRVASFLITAMLAPPGCVILFDDYVDRPEYHVVEQHLKPVRFEGRMAEFIVAPLLDPKAALFDLLQYSTQSR